MKTVVIIAMRSNIIKASSYVELHQQHQYSGGSAQLIVVCPKQAEMGDSCMFLTGKSGLNEVRLIADSFFMF